GGGRKQREHGRERGRDAWVKTVPGPPHRRQHRGPGCAWRRRTRRGAASSLGQIALLFGLPASLPRLVRHSPGTPWFPKYFYNYEPERRGMTQRYLRVRVEAAGSMTPDV